MTSPRDKLLAEYLKAIPVQELPEVYNNMDDVTTVKCR